LSFDFVYNSSMKVAIVSHRITDSLEGNLSKMESFIQQAVDSKANLILFSETATTGLANKDNPVHDILLGEEIPGKISKRFCQLAKENKIHIAFGLFEREEGKLFDTAILINNAGEIAIKYRRISKGWHWPNSDPNVYVDGCSLTSATLDIGKVCFLLCGDLFEEDLVQRVHDLHPDYLLFPFARTVEGSGTFQEIWDRDDLPGYKEQVKKIGATTFMAGYIYEEFIGGAMAINKSGEIIDALPLRQEGMLLIEV